jgi:hypothetical protein
MFAEPAGDDDEAAAIPFELESSVEGEGLVAAKIEMLFYWRGIYTELDNAFSRREEWMASECLFKGSITCRDGDTQEIIAG